MQSLSVNYLWSERWALTREESHLAFSSSPPVDATTVKDWQEDKATLSLSRALGILKIHHSAQRQTRYATWLKHKVPASEVAIFQAAVPEDLIRSLSVNHLWSDGVETDTWKRVIWHSRRSDKLPKDLRWMADKDLWIGHIARSLHSRYVAMESYTMIKSSDTLSVKIDGDWRKAIQWVVYDSDAEDLFALRCKGKTWIHSTGKLVDETPK